MRAALTFPLLRNGPLPLPIGERNACGNTYAIALSEGEISVNQLTTKVGASLMLLGGQSAGNIFIFGEENMMRTFVFAALCLLSTVSGAAAARVEFVGAINI